MARIFLKETILRQFLVSLEVVELQWWLSGASYSFGVGAVQDSVSTMLVVD